MEEEEEDSKRFVWFNFVCVLFCFMFFVDSLLLWFVLVVYLYRLVVFFIILYYFRNF